MTASLHRSNKDVTRELAATLRGKLDRKYARIFGAVANEWDRRFAGKDPSDACVSVRISGRAESFRRAA